jgi:hypothetical protein
MPQNPSAARIAVLIREGAMAGTTTRRQLLHRTFVLALVGSVLPRAGLVAGTCVDAGSESLRASLNYVATAADPAVACARCAFFAAGPAGGACGGCQILSGPVDAAGHCDSFSPPG